MVTSRNDALSIARRAEEVLVDTKQRERMQAGYTRIDPDLIASGANVVVLYRELEKLLGAFIRDKSASGIIINFARPRGMIHMTCAHELGHYFLGHSSTTDETVEEPDLHTPQEIHANLFAYHLLTPKWLVASLMRRKRLPATRLQEPSVVYQMSLRLGISYSAMVWQLFRLQLIPHKVAEILAKVSPASLKKQALGGRVLANGMSDVWIVDSADKDHILEPGMGDQFVFELPNHLSGGHIWSADEAASNGYQLKPFLQESPPTPNRVDGNTVVGSGQATIKYELSLPAAAEDATDGPFKNRLQHHSIALSEKRPWGPVENAIDHLQLQAKQELVRSGYSRTEAGARLKKIDRD